jgi:SAM-dependent methyltransferase
VLEAGCGEGHLTRALLDRGAELTAIDLSPKMVERARERAAGARVLLAPLEDTGLEAASFDRVVGLAVLHHTDVARAAAEVRRLLRPGGRAVFFENQDRNPLLRFARRRLMGLPGVHRVGTRDEHPLTRRDFELLGEAFDDVELAYPNLYCFEALGRALGHRAILPLRRLDALVWGRAPRLRRFSYHVLVTLRVAP